MSLFRCPICFAPLTCGERTYTCPNGHSYDISKEGYVHLLPPNQMHSKAPGDDKAMVAARNRFLSAGYYQPLRAALEELALRYTPASSAVVDSGCGEGILYRRDRAGSAGSRPRPHSGRDRHLEICPPVGRQAGPGE